MIVVGLLILILVVQIVTALFLASGTYIVKAGLPPGTVDITVTQTFTTTQESTTTISSITTITTNRTVTPPLVPILAQGTNVALPTSGGSAKPLAYTLNVDHYYSAYLLNYTVTNHLPNSVVTWAIGQTASGSLSGSGTVNLTQDIHGSGAYTITFIASRENTTLTFEVVGK